MSNGGAAVTEYRVWYEQSIGDFVVLASVVDREYTTSVALTAGAYYLLKVEAKNSVGYSLSSDNIQVHAV